MSRRIIKKQHFRPLKEHKIKNTEKHCNIHKMYENIEKHSCGNENMIKMDRPLILEIGEYCEKCGCLWTISLSDLKLSL